MPDLQGLFQALYDETNHALRVTGSAGATVSDTAYGSGWNGDTTTAPSKNAVYDKIETLSAGSSTGTFNGLINCTDATYGVVADGQFASDGAVADGVLGTVSSASITTSNATAGMVVALSKDAVVSGGSMSNGSPNLTLANNDLPSWVKVGTVVHVDKGITGSGGKLLNTTVASITDSGHIVLANNCTNPSGITGQKVSFHSFHKTTFATVSAGSATLTNAAPYGFAGATICWGTDNRAAFAAAVAAAKLANKTVYTPPGNFLIFTNAANPWAMAAWTDTVCRVIGAGRTTTNFMLVHDAVSQTWAGGLLRTGSNGSMEAADFKVSYMGNQQSIQTSEAANYVYKAEGPYTLTTRVRFARVDTDSVYRPKYAFTVAAGTGNANKRLEVDDCKFYSFGSGFGIFVNPSRVVANGVLNSTTTVTSATIAFIQDDVGKLISGTGIPTGTRILSVESSSSATMTAAATATASGVSLTLGGQDMEVRARLSRFDSGMQMTTTVDDEQYNSHATYLHPSISYEFLGCTFRVEVNAGAVYHLHSSGGPDDATKFARIVGCVIDGFVGGGYLVQSNVTKFECTHSTFRAGGLSIGSDAVISDCDHGGSSINITGTAKTVVINRPIWNKNAPSVSSTMVSCSGAGAGTTVIVNDATVVWPGTNWTQFLGLAPANAMNAELNHCRISGITGSSNGIASVSVGHKVIVRGGAYSGGSAQGLFFCTGAAATITGYMRFEGVDFTGVTGTAIFDQTATGTDGPFRVHDCLFGLATAPVNSAGRTGNTFRARNGYRVTAVAAAANTVLDHDFAEYKLSGSATNIDNVWRNTAVRTRFNTETIIIRNASGATQTFKNGTGNLTCKAWGAAAADLAVADGDAVMLNGDGAGAWTVRPLAAV